MKKQTSLYTKMKNTTIRISLNQSKQGKKKKILLVFLHYTYIGISFWNG